jgi:hypothetical protein
VEQTPSQDDFKTDHNADLIAKCIMAVDDDDDDDAEDAAADDEDVETAEPTKVGVFSRIGQIITERIVARPTSDASGSSDSPALQSDEEANFETETVPSVVGTTTVGRRGFLKGLRDIVSTRSIDKKFELPETTVDDAVTDESAYHVNGEMVGEITFEPVETATASSSNADLLASIQSYIAFRDDAAAAPDETSSTEPSSMTMDTTELNALMKDGATCSAPDLKSGLILLDAELVKRDLPDHRRAYLTTLQSYLLTKQVEMAQKDFEAK